MKGRKFPGKYTFCSCVNCLGTGKTRKWFKKFARQLRRNLDKEILRKERKYYD